MYKRIVGMLSGALAITVISLGCSSVYALSEAKEKAAEDRKTINRILENTATISEGMDYDIVEYVEKGDYSGLEFTDVDEFLNSLQSLVRVDGADILYEQRVYDVSEEKMVSLYKSESENVVVAVNSDGDIEYCMFKDLDAEKEEDIKRLSQDSEYRFKVVNNGFILEPDVDL